MNIFDLDKGRDIVLTLTKTVRADGEEGVAIQINDKSVNKPLTNDVELGNSWINDAKRWYNAYTVKSPEYLSIVADDKIPYYDKAIGKFVPKTEEDFLEAEKKRNDAKKQADAAAEAAAEVLKEQVPQSVQYGASMEADEDNDMKLPF